MKAWFTYCHMFEPDSEEGGYGGYNVKFGVDWYPHKPFTSKKFKAWRGFSLTFYLLKYMVVFNVVDDYAAYEYRVNYRSSSYLKEKLEARKNEKV